MESKEVSEPQDSEALSGINTVDESFLDDTVIFKEPTDKQRPTSEVPPANEGVVGANFWKADDTWAATAIGETPTGNTLQAVKRADGSGYKLSLRDGGTLPAEFSGWYTSYSKAEEHGRLYLNKQWEEVRASAATA